MLLEFPKKAEGHPILDDITGKMSVQAADSEEVAVCNENLLVGLANMLPDIVRNLRYHGANMEVVNKKDEDWRVLARRILDDEKFEEVTWIVDNPEEDEAWQWELNNNCTRSDDE